MIITKRTPYTHWWLQHNARELFLFWWNWTLCQSGWNHKHFKNACQFSPKTFWCLYESRRELHILFFCIKGSSKISSNQQKRGFNRRKKDASEGLSKYSELNLIEKNCSHEKDKRMLLNLKALKNIPKVKWAMCTDRLLPRKTKI